jgi:hypothetical protein
MKLRSVAALAVLLLLAAVSFAQEADGLEGLDFGLGIAIGAQSFPNPDYTGAGTEPELITYQSVSMTPDLALGKFGIGLDVTLNYRFTGGDGGEFEVRREDWVPDADTNFLELYLPKLRYVRWGVKGDPLFVLLGSVDNGVLGNGFILGGYTNTQFLPERRIFGLSLDVDGQLFNFPYVGLETFAANLAAFDVIGSRLFVRPLVGTSIPVLKNLQVGGTVVVDRDPFYFARKDPLGAALIDSYLPADITDDSLAQVFVWGADFRLPILSNPAVSLATFGDFVMQQQNTGGMVGIGGRLFSIIPYGAQLRILGENFIPVYFDGAYDLFRPEKYAVYAGVPGFTTDSYIGWFASLGVALLDDQIMFNAALDGPFNPDPAGGTFAKPHLLASLSLAEGLLGGFSLDASYDKKGIDNLADLINPEDAVIGARLNYRIENAVITLVYDLQYDPYPEPGDDPWIVTSGLESSITLF